MVGAHVDDVRGARISVAVQLSSAQEVAEALGLSVAANRPARSVNRPVVGLGGGVDFSLLVSACRGHLVGVCSHGVSVHTVAVLASLVRGYSISCAALAGRMPRTALLSTALLSSACFSL